MEPIRFKIIGEDWEGNRVEITDRDPMLQVGVIAIANVDQDSGWWIASGRNFYVWALGVYWAVDFPGLILYLNQFPDQHVLLGKMVSNETFAEVLAGLKADPDLPKKVNYKSEEKRPVLFSSFDLLTKE